MASEPKRRHSKGRKRTRRAAINLAVNLINCKNCGKPTRSHTVCPGCGSYGQRPGVLGGKNVKKEQVKVTRGDSVTGGDSVTKA